MQKIRNELDNTKFKKERGTSVKFPEFEKSFVQWLSEMFDDICM